MKPLTLDIDLVVQSMRDLCRESSEYFLDIESGRVASISRALLKALAQRSGDIDDAVPAWEAPLIPIARAIVVSGAGNFVRIPEAFGRPEHKWMLEFAETLRGQKLRETLQRSLKGRESCERFKEILKDHPEEQNRWQVFCQKKWEDKVAAWLSTLHIIPIQAKPSSRRVA
jgi:hypothetical protein